MKVLKSQLRQNITKNLIYQHMYHTLQILRWLLAANQLYYMSVVHTSMSDINELFLLLPRSNFISCHADHFMYN